MFSFQKLLSKDDKLFSLLEMSAEEANKSIQALNQILSKPDQLPSLSDFHRTKEADKEITAQINQAVVNDFVTDIDREDIELLSSVLYKIPKTVEKIEATRPWWKLQWQIIEHDFAEAVFCSRSMPRRRHAGKGPSN